MSPTGTPTPTGRDAEKGVSMVALERYRQQTNSLQRELVDKKEELAEQASMFEKKKEALEAEVAALTKTNRVSGMSGCRLNGNSEQANSRPLKPT